ncbi:MAG: protein-glutamate O-methyltransferase CheR [Anaerolineae bacterium]
MPSKTGFLEELSDQDYERFRDLLLRRSGLHFPQPKRRDLEMGIRYAMRDADEIDLDSFYQRLSIGKTTDLNWENLIQHITVGETYFFRNAAHFNALRKHILPPLIAERRRNGLQMLRLWSAGCATGEEPYSLAILLRHMLPDISNWHIMILGTDINRESLMAAQRGVYRSWSFRSETPESARSLYFRQYGDRYELNPDIRNMVTFGYLNLVRATYPAVESHTVGLDLIVCRNVSIYFDHETTRAMIQRFYDALLDGGWLVLGHSETMPDGFEKQFQAVSFAGAVAYRKLGTSATQALARLTSGRATATTEEPPSPPPDYYQLALALVDTGHPNRAREQLLRLLSENPRHTEACWLMGKIHADQGQWGDAENWLKQATRIDPLMAPAHYLLGLIYEQQGHAEPAITAYKRALYADRHFILGHFSLANLYADKGMVREARRHWLNAAELLYRHALDDIIPFSDGLSVRRLLPVVLGRLGGAFNRR